MVKEGIEIMKLLKYAHIAALLMIVGAGCDSEEEKPETPEVCRNVRCGSGVCVEKDGVAVCETPQVCVDVACGNGACVEEDGEAACECDDGYESDGLSCVASEASDPCEELCGQTPSHGTWSCGETAESCALACEQGYDLVDEACTPQMQALTPELLEDISIGEHSPGAVPPKDYPALLVSSGASSGQEKRSFVEFDLSDVPKDYDVQEATLRLIASGTMSVATEVLVGAYFPETPLSESDVWSWDEHWSASSTLIRPSTTLTVGPDEGGYDFDVQAVVQDWLTRSDGRDKLTLIIRHAVKPDPWAQVSFESKDNGPLTAPRLTMVVSPTE